MKISYNWLKDYVHTNLQPDELGKLLTDCGLEVEAIEKIETIKGGLKDIVVGEVLTKEKHPDADRLNLTTVAVGNGSPLHIVCGASNVAVGQKVLVAKIGAQLYPTNGEPFEIKKSKIRGQLSEGMICAEDEIGVGTSHEGIMVLPENTKVGTPAAAYFNVQEDTVIEIGLTANRIDAASHVGVARDIVAVLNTIQNKHVELKMPVIKHFTTRQVKNKITVKVEDKDACPRYAGVQINNVTIAESPEWIKNRLNTIGIRSINNIVDITNYVLHELGQPLHAFDADKINGSKIIVKKLPDKTRFTTLDGVERELSSEDLMICDEQGGMCIAGVFGGLASGVTDKTKNIFLESAYFNPTTIRKTSKRHGLKTDASFRFERGANPNITIIALTRAANLIQEIAGGTEGDIIDIYPNPISNVKVPFSFEKCYELIGKKIDEKLIKNILKFLDIQVLEESADCMLLEIPSYRVDVTHEQDVIEEILRIYGYNHVEVNLKLNASLSYSGKLNALKIQNTVANMLVNNGFTEMMGLSLTKSEYLEKLGKTDAQNAVKLKNALSSDLDVLRQSLLYSGLEAIQYNQNRKMSDLKLFEFGRTYHVTGEKFKYQEKKHLSLFITGKREDENWNANKQLVDFYSLKGLVDLTFERLGIKTGTISNFKDTEIMQGTQYGGEPSLVSFGAVNKQLLTYFDIKQPVYFANFNWDLIINAIAKNSEVRYKEIVRFPEVRRDLALLVDKSVNFDVLKQLAFKTEKKLLKQVGLFDVYEGDKLPEGKKSYAMYFILQDESATLTDTQIDNIMQNLMNAYKQHVGAEIR